MRIRCPAITDAISARDTLLTSSDDAQKEFFAAWAIFICILLLVITFFVSYMLQMKKVTAIHETVISIFAGKNSDNTLRCFPSNF